MTSARGVGGGAGAADRAALRRLPYSLDERPFIVIWETTRACDLVCHHCRAEAVADRHPLELSTAQAEGLFDDLTGFGHPPPLLVLTGGDPFQRPDLVELVAAATARGIPVSLAPSVTPTLTRRRLEELAAAGAKAVSLSLDGATAAVHDGFRGVDGVFDATLEAAGWVREAGLKLQVNTTATPHDVEQLADIAALSVELDANLWSVFFLVATGRGQGLAALSATQTEDVLHFLHDAGRRLSVKATEAPHFRRVLSERAAMSPTGHPPRAGPLYLRLRRRLERLLTEAERPTVRRPPLDVNAGRGFAFVSHTGVVHPSGFLPLAAGSVRETSIVDVYRHAPLFRRLRDPTQLSGVCGRCAFAQICGGSRSRAFAATGDPLGDDPACVETAPSPSSAGR